MKSQKTFLSLYLVAASFMLYAQTPLPVPRNIQAAYDKGTRSVTGTPGKNYWQNFADYIIQIRFEPATRLISGTEEIIYTNNSPDTLRKIVFKLYPNLYKKGSPRFRKIDPEDLSDGVSLEKITIDGNTHPTDSIDINGTNMVLPVAPLLPNQSMHLTIAYSYYLNKGSHIRTGEVDKGSWFIAYFFPRIAVYDDIDGWNIYPYLGTQEFYNDFCNFKLSVNVPKDIIVWATGDLQNSSEVLSPVYCQRLAAAEKSDGITTIIDTFDLKKGEITANHLRNTFHFDAKNVTDVAVAISNHYIWKSSSLVVDSASGRRTRVDAVFNPEYEDFYEVIDFARKTLESMSYTFPRWPFPYSHETVFNGLDEMEYPMMANDEHLTIRAKAIDLTDHEIFHTMFPFYMGTNETKYGWMDEGWATLGEWIITSLIDSSVVDSWSIDNYEKIAGKEADLPGITLTTEEFGDVFFTNSYPKPALAYMLVACPDLCVGCLAWPTCWLPALAYVLVACPGLCVG